MRILQTKRAFHKEFKRQIRMAIVAAIGFTIAFAWKEAVYDTFNTYVARFLEVSLDHYLTQNYTAIAITLMGVLVIFITSKLIRE
ncbi:MAG: DUF5654 family protein [Nanoarchaeota archaeon]